MTSRRRIKGEAFKPNNIAPAVKHGGVASCSRPVVLPVVLLHCTAWIEKCSRTTFKFFSFTSFVYNLQLPTSTDRQLKLRHN